MASWWRQSERPGMRIVSSHSESTNTRADEVVGARACRCPRSTSAARFQLVGIYIATSALRLSRVCVEESLLYAARREAFGKPLGELQSVRMHLANMALHVEMLQALLEAVVWQMKVLPRAEANALGDVIALLKAQASRCYEACARSTTMVLGGNALYADGVGARVEPAVAQVKAQQIPAGAEDVMMDYAGRVMLKKLAKL